MYQFACAFYVSVRLCILCISSPVHIMYQSPVHFMYQFACAFFCTWCAVKISWQQ